ncbi:collagen alpha-1(XII) chain-like [Haliotis asinina]|uniref:collagen alpha-1(XII) chain-like n=1 Tax=Haliotis asinina TaxID=109174 RepID=UPI0035325E5B
MDLVILLDSSHSVGATNFGRLKAVMVDVVTAASIDDGQVRVAVVTFSTSSAIEFCLGDFTSKKDVQKKIQGIGYLNGYTNIASGLCLVKDDVFQVTKGDRPDVRNVLLLIVGGPSNVRSSLTIPTATLVKESGVHIFVLGIQDADVDEITSIASEPTEFNYIMGQFDDLKHIEEDLFKTMCTGVARAEAMSSSVTTTAKETHTTTDVPTTGVTTNGDTTPTVTTMPVTSMTETTLSSMTTTGTTATSTSEIRVTTTKPTFMSTTLAGNTKSFTSLAWTTIDGLTATNSTSSFTTPESTGTTTTTTTIPVTSTKSDTTVTTSFYTRPKGSTTPSTSMTMISTTGATTTIPTDTTNPASTTTSAPTAGLKTDKSTTAGFKTPNACYRQCDQAAAVTAETTGDFHKDLQLPKQELYRQIGKRTSTSNLSESEMMTGLGVSLVLLAPFAFLVGWDVLDFIRYIDRRFRNRNRQGLY